MGYAALNDILFADTSEGRASPEFIGLLLRFPSPPITGKIEV